MQFCTLEKVLILELSAAPHTGTAPNAEKELALYGQNLPVDAMSPFHSSSGGVAVTP